MDDIKNWRPITILNNVYKVYAKFLATCLQPFLPHRVHKTHTCFMYESSIFDNIFVFWEMVAIVQETKQDLAIMLLDFEKDYGKIYWNVYMRLWAA